MAYQTLDDFRLGMDRRRKRVAGTPGSLWTLKNAHISRGGDIERAKKWVPKYTLPTGQTQGAAAVNDTLYAFGSDASPSMPAGVTYQRLQHPDGTTALTAVLDWQRFDGKLYVVAEFEDGEVYHFYDGEIVGDWYYGIVRDDMGTTGTELAEAIAEQFATIIDADEDYSASRTGNIVTVQHAAPFTAEATVEGTGFVNISNETVGVDQLTTLTFSTDTAVGDRIGIELTFDNETKSFGTVANPTPVGRSALTFKNKMHSAGGSLVNFSGVNQPTRFDRAHPDVIGAGFINAANQEDGSQEVTALDVYNGQLLIFSRRSAQVWAIDADPSNNAFVQLLKNTGTPARHSVLAYGNSDVFYLDKTGIRSIKARSNSDMAFSSDVGTALDPFIQGYIAQLTEDQVEAAAACYEPNDGRFMLALGARIFVFSYFPTSKVSAWSYYEPGFSVSDFVIAGDRLYARSGDTIYLYGGEDNATYPDDDEQEVEVELPFMDGKKPATKKAFNGLDAAVENEWQVFLLVNPNDESQEIPAGRVNKITYNDGKWPASVEATHVAMRLRCSRGGNASISALAIHYEGSEAQ